MARSLNKTMIIGNLGAQPEVRTTPSGIKVANISVATSRRWRDKNGQDQEKTEWHRVTLWDRKDGGGLASLAEEYMNKGDRVYVEGPMEYGSYDKVVGGETVKMYTSEINAREVVMLGGNAPANGGNGGGQRSQQTQATAAPDTGGTPFQEEDDLPF